MADWIVVVDDNVANLQMAGKVLSGDKKKVTAMKSGRKLLEFMKENEPDLILLDIMMPEMDGFETLKLLRQQEKDMGREAVPVIFLTADEDVDTEKRGFEVGVSDYIRKPFNPDVLLRRVDNIVSKQERMMSLKTEATTDKLTGLLNKGAANEEISKCCAEKTGCLLMIDLDSFKLVNDLYGHEMGDQVLISFSNVIRNSVPEGSVLGRIGGDEFVAFGKNVTEESEVREITRKLNDDFLAEAKRLMGEDMSIPLGASVGAIYVPKYGKDYDMLFRMADKMLYIVKKRGKHGYATYSPELVDEPGSKELDLKSLQTVLSERNIPDAALQLDSEAFTYVYRYMVRYVTRNRIGIGNVLLTLTQGDGISDAEFMDYCDEMGIHIREKLRKSDIFMRYRATQYYIALMEVKEGGFSHVIENIISSWNEEHPGSLKITYEENFVGSVPEGE